MKHIVIFLLLLLLIAETTATTTTPNFPTPPPLPEPLKPLNHSKLMRELQRLPEKTNESNGTITCYQAFTDWWNIPANIWIGLSNIGCAVTSFFNGIIDAFSNSPFGGFIIGAVEILAAAGNLLSKIIIIFFNALVLLVVNFGAAIFSAFAFLLNLLIVFFSFITTVVPNFLVWLPWIIMITMLSTFVDAVNRAVRAKTIIPFAEFFILWKNVFLSLFKFFEKIFDVVWKIVSKVIEVVKAIV